MSRNSLGTTQNAKFGKRVFLNQFLFLSPQIILVSYTYDCEFSKTASLSHILTVKTCGWVFPDHLVFSSEFLSFFLDIALFNHLGALLRGGTAAHRSKKGSEKVLGREGFWGRVLGKGSEKRACYRFCSKKGF